MDLTRMLKHLFAPHWIVSARVSARACWTRSRTAIARIRAIASTASCASSSRPDCIRGRCWRGQTPRERAVELFSRCGVWDTAHNSGVLIYVQLVDRRIEIVADRGISRKRAAGASGRRSAGGMEAAFRERHFEAGALDGISGDHRTAGATLSAAGRQPQRVARPTGGFIGRIED